MNACGIFDIHGSLQGHTVSAELYCKTARHVSELILHSDLDCVVGKSTLRLQELFGQYSPHLRYSPFILLNNFPEMKTKFKDQHYDSLEMVQHK